MKYLGCQECDNYRTIELHDAKLTCCWADVKDPLKCPLKKRVLNPDIAEFFWATCERYKDEKL